MYCANCGTQYNGNFCPNCGEPAQIKRYCANCGTEIADVRLANCPACGAPLAQQPGQTYQQPMYAQPNVIINNIQAGGCLGRPKSKWVAFLLCLFLGYLGAHRFYEGKIGTGILYLCTFGLLGIGVIVDLICILLKPDPYFV